MPDMERLVRGMELYLAKDEPAKKIIRARHQGQDQARKEILIVVAVIFALAVLVICVI